MHGREAGGRAGGVVPVADTFLYSELSEYTKKQLLFK